ncbi:MAG: response regulator [Nitrospirae bacterium]|nr:response regulator [Nitrospirota bacterium]
MVENPGNFSQSRILVVEDESIVAMNICERLKELGYEVADVVSTGADAIKRAGELDPDLVLMDIVLKGNMDGVETAEKIRNTYDIPVIFLTAYSDNDTLRRAKITEPYGYILKPFEQRELLIAIEIAVYKHELERRLKASENWLLATLKLMSAALITTDINGTVTFMNAEAAAITGWTMKEAIGEDITAVFNVSQEDPVRKVLQEGMVISKNSLLTNKKGLQHKIDFSAISITNESKRNMGVAILIHHASGD